jgi:hypothetical protein
MTRSTAWIPVDGRDAVNAFPSFVNPDHVTTATFWTDSDQRRTVTIRLVTGEQLDLREPRAINAVGRLTSGTDAPEPEPDPEPLPIAATCGRRR